MIPYEILYTPLDTQPQPKVDIQKLLKWNKSTFAVQQAQTRQTDGSNAIPDELYPWEPTYPRRNYSWVNNFDKEFPEISKYFYEAFGIKETELLSASIIPVKSDYSGLAVWHTDKDEHGLRMYLKNEDTEDSLLIMPTKEFFTSRQPSIGKVLDNSPNPHIQTDKVYSANIISPNQSFFINNINAVHAVKVNKPGSIRIAVSCHGFGPMSTMTTNMQNLIQRSVEKFPESVIRWTPPIN